MRRGWMAGLLTILLLFSVGCGEQKANLPADDYLKKLNMRVVEKRHADHPLWREYTVYLTDAQGRPADVDVMKVVLDMTTMHHPHHDTFKRIQKGEYHMLHKKIAMAGNWVATVTLVHGRHTLKKQL